MITPRCSQSLLLRIDIIIYFDQKQKRILKELRFQVFRAINPRFSSHMSASVIVLQVRMLSDKYKKIFTFKFTINF